MHVIAYIWPACTLCSYRAYTKYGVLLNVSFCLYIVSICMYAVNNHILKFRISVSKSGLESGSLAEIFIYIWKSISNLHLYLEILHNLSGNPETLHEILKSAWNLKMFLKSRNLQQNPKISKSCTDFFQWSTPRGCHIKKILVALTQLLKVPVPI